MILLAHMKVSSVTTHEDSRAAKNLVDFDGRIEEAENALSDSQKVSVTWPIEKLGDSEIPNLNLQLAIAIPSCYNIGFVNMKRIGQIACIWSGWNASFVISGLGFVAISNKPKSPLCVASVFATFKASFMQAWWLLGFVKLVRGILYIIVSVSHIWLRLVSLKNCFLAKQLLCS